jgi:hypothetical protein
MMSMRAFPWVLLLCLLARPLAAQVVAGRVIDHGSETGVSDVSIALVDSIGAVIQDVVSDASGEFVVRAPRIGWYRIRAARIGYEVTTSRIFGVGAGDTVRVELRIATEPITLPPLRVVSPGTPPNRRLAAAGFYERQEHFRNRGARFFTLEDIERLGPARWTDLLREVPQVRIGGRSYQYEVTTRRGRPMTVWINGQHYRGIRVEELVSGANITAMEVYPEWPPAQYMCSRCDPRSGAIVIWTGMR